MLLQACLSLKEKSEYNPSLLLDWHWQSWKHTENEIKLKDCALCVCVCVCCVKLKFCLFKKKKKKKKREKSVVVSLVVVNIINITLKNNKLELIFMSDCTLHKICTKQIYIHLLFEVL